MAPKAFVGQHAAVLQVFQQLVLIVDDLGRRLAVFALAFGATRWAASTSMPDLRPLASISIARFDAR
jgi:hypothetical protein